MVYVGIDHHASKYQDDVFKIIHSYPNFRPFGQLLDLLPLSILSRLNLFSLPIPYIIHYFLRLLILNPYSL